MVLKEVDEVDTPQGSGSRLADWGDGSLFSERRTGHSSATLAKSMQGCWRRWSSQHPHQGPGGSVGVCPASIHVLCGRSAMSLWGILYEMLWENGLPGLLLQTILSLYKRWELEWELDCALSLILFITFYEHNF